MSTFDLCINIIESFIIITFIQLTLKGKKIDIWYFIFIFIDFINTTIHNYLLLPEISLTLTTLLFEFIYAEHLNRHEHIQNIFLSVYIKTIFSITASLIIITFGLVFGYVFSGAIYYFICIFIKIIQIIILYISTYFMKKYHFLLTNKLIYILISLVILNCIDSAVIDLIFYYNIYNFNTLFLVFSYCILLLLFMLFFFESKKDQDEKLALQKEMLKLENQEKMQSLNKNNLLAMKKFKHDMKHVFVSMKYYLDKHDYEQLSHALMEHSKELEENDFIVETGNDLIDFLLVQKNEMMKREKIDFILGYDGCDIPMNENHFFVLMGNLMDNAIENCQSHYLKQMRLDIGQINEYFYIKIQNSITESVLTYNKDLHTTKDDGEEHGIGLSSVRLLVKQYHGLIDFSENEMFFIVKVLIPYHPKEN